MRTLKHNKKSKKPIEVLPIGNFSMDFGSELFCTTHFKDETPIDKNEYDRIMKILKEAKTDIFRIPGDTKYYSTLKTSATNLATGYHEEYYIKELYNKEFEKYVV